MEHDRGTTLASYASAADALPVQALFGTGWKPGAKDAYIAQDLHKCAGSPPVEPHTAVSSISTSCSTASTKPAGLTSLGIRVVASDGLHRVGFKRLASRC